MKNKKAIFTTKWITYTAMLTALVVATGFIPPIPTPAGRIYWVDGIVLTAAYLMDPIAAFIAGGIGSLLYDVLASPAMMIPSLLIHGLQGAIVSLIVHILPEKREPIWAAIAAIIGAAEVVTGYFLYRLITSGMPVAITNIPRNIIQEAIGITAAMIICYATTLKLQLKKSGLLPDFARSVFRRKKVPEKAAEQTE